MFIWLCDIEGGREVVSSVLMQMMVLIAVEYMT